MTEVHVWTAKEIFYLKQNYKEMSAKEIGRVLGRTERAVAAQCATHDIRKHHVWTPKQIKFFDEHVATLSPTAIANKLGITRSIVATRIKRLKLTTNTVPIYRAARKEWTAEDEQYLINHYNTTPNKILMVKLDRTSDGITNKAKKLGLLKPHVDKPIWTEEQIQYVRKHMTVQSMSEMAKHLGIKPDIVNRMKKKLTSQHRRITRKK